MSNPQTKTNNDPMIWIYKIELRKKYTPKDAYVLDCFAGEGMIWEQVNKETDLNIKVLPIDEKDYGRIGLKGNNIKFLKSLDLNKFQVIDLDAYGIPYDQLDILFNRKYKGHVFVTAIQTMIGQLPAGMLEELGYSKQMVRKIPTLFSKNGLEKLKQYLAIKGVSDIRYYSHNRKNYIYFNTLING